jgi:hypothetical protein
MGEFAVDYVEAAMADDVVLTAITEQGANTKNYIPVPKNANLITAVKISVGQIGTDVITGNTFTVHLIGPEGEQVYAGPVVSRAGAAATDGGVAYSKPETYMTAIPCSGLSQIGVKANFSGDDPGACHIAVQLEFDGVPGVIKDADCREIAIGAAANTLLALTTKMETTGYGNFKANGKRVREIRIGCAWDPEGNATAGLLLMPGFELAGGGLLTNNKPLCMVGPSGISGADTDVAGSQAVVANLERVVPGVNGIATAQSGEIVAKAQAIESISPGQAIMCLCFG